MGLGMTMGKILKILSSLLYMNFAATADRLIIVRGGSRGERRRLEPRSDFKLLIFYRLKSLGFA